MASKVKSKRDSTHLVPSRRVKRGSTVQEESGYEVETQRPDQWLRDEPGEEYRYARRPKARNGIQAYQQSAALKEQRSIHCPFYMEDIAREPESPPPPQRREPQAPRVLSYQAPTHFYPHTDAGKVSPVGRVRSVQLQRVLPSYELSTEETRETGLGPALERGVYPKR